MSKQYEMTDEELQAMIYISKQENMPVIKIGNYWAGNEKQDAANAFWKKLADKYNFVWDSAIGIPGGNNRQFTATPKPAPDQAEGEA